MITGLTQIPHEVNNFYSKALLRRAVAYFVHTKWAQIKDISQGSGTMTIKFRRYGNLSPATTPLTEGITPTASQMSTTDITAIVKQFGAYIEITDLVSYTSQDKILLERAEELGDQAGNTLDTLCRDVLNAGTNVQYEASRTSRVTVAAGDDITLEGVKKAVRVLKNNLTRRIMEMIDPTDGVGTTPISQCYIGIVHPNTTYTLKGITGFVPVEKYPNQRDVMENEVGKLDEVRFIESTEAKVFTGAGASGIDVYSTLIFGRDAYGITRISGKTLENIVKPIGSGQDPLNQRGTSGWKVTFITKILNNDFLLRLEHSVAS